MDEPKFTTHEVTYYKGQLPEMGATDWWTPEQWKEYNDYVEELKRTGEYMKPVKQTWHIQESPEFDMPKKEDSSFENFALLIPSGKKKSE